MFLLALTSPMLFMAGRSYEKVDSTRSDSILKSLPHGPRCRLTNVLKKISAEYKVGPQAVNLNEFDSAFELQSAEGTWSCYCVLRLFIGDVLC